MVAITHVKPRNRFVEFSRDETRQSIVERFEKQVRKSPQLIAVQSGRVQLTYDALNQSANRLARVILRQSRDNNPIAILLEHDVAAVVAIFGALKGCKIFLLLDPALPQARIGQILDDSGSSLIVTNDQNLAIAEDLLQGYRRLVNVDRCDTDLEASNLDLEIRPDSISYILYTSGSTGRPKGVIRTHGNDLHNIRNRTNSFCISGDDRITLLGSFSTGQGMTDIYSALLNGATLYPRNLKREGIHGLAEWLMQERITIYHSSATFFRRFVGELSSDTAFPQLRIVNVGGEPVTWKDVESYKSHFSENCVLVNELSCSEASTFAQFFVNKETKINMTVPVGYPVDDKDVLILDDRGSPLRTGDGEIAISSRFLSPGYWNQPDLTKLAFSVDAESQDVRIYRTGDLGRKSADGCLEYLGRKDARVKIRGYRVECHEIELALLQIPAVHQAFVTGRQDAQNETHLIAYVVCAKEARPGIRELRAALTRRLPGYMVPAAFVFLDALPLTATGKIDRGALPEPDSTRPALDTSYVSPRDPIEKSIAAICSEILNIDTLGVHDNLFDLGGHSLSAMQIVAQATRMFGVDVPLQRFYESPTVAGLSVIVASSRGSAEAPNASASSQVVPAGHVPLSYFQERLWFMEQWDPGKPTYNICQAYHLEGPLHAPAVEESLNTVIARHQILRASFDADDGKPSQTILPVFRLRLATRDSRTAAETEKYAAATRLAQEEARQAFDLRGPLLRALLIQLADKEHVLVLTVHQMVCDGWSMQILLCEFWNAYEAISRNERPSLPPLVAQYSDFAVWQRQLLNDARLQSHLAYWRNTLGGTLTALGLPTDYPRPNVETFRGSRVLLVLSERLTESLNALSRREGVTLFITLMAAFKILLYRYSGQHDLIVGFPIANRSRGETIGLIGFFLNTLVARATITGRMTFEELLFRVRDVCHAAYKHQDLPFEKLVEHLRPPRDSGRNPIFQAMFTFHNVPLTHAAPPELRSTPINIDNGTCKVDLTLSLAERDGQLTGFFEYSTDLFKRDTIERFEGHFQTLLEAVVADPNQPIAALPMLTEAERHKILVEWNNTAGGYPKDKCIHQIFQEQVERTPEAIAAEFENHQITYGELNRRANQLAHYLISFGIGPETLVGICTERSIEMVVGLLGVLKAGGGYVPLDPAYPKDRLRVMIEDAQLSVVLSQKKLVEDRGWSMEAGDPQCLRPGSGQASIFDPGLTIICLDRDWPLIAQHKNNNPERAVSPKNLAYIIYTSGSTGQPKGVEIQHQSIANCLSAIGKPINLTAQDAWLAITTIAFDIAALEIFLPLISGAKLILANREESVDAELLCRRLKGSGATVMQATPSMWKLLLDAGWECPGDFTILCGGEAMSRDLAEALLTRGEVWNLYGPTEATIWSMVHKVESAEGPVPIGGPIANTNVCILDSHLQPVPIGVHGELYLGGDGLARGYSNRRDAAPRSRVRWRRTKLRI